MSAVIAVKALKRSYRIGTAGVAALRGVGFSVETGDFLAIMGRRGPASRR